MASLLVAYKALKEASGKALSCYGQVKLPMTLLTYGNTHVSPLGNFALR